MIKYYYTTRRDSEPRRRTTTRPIRVARKDSACVTIRKPIRKHDGDFDLGNRSRLGHGNDDLNVAIAKATKALRDLSKTEDEDTTETIKRAIALLKKAKHMIGDDEDYESEFGTKRDSSSRKVKHL